MVGKWVALDLDVGQLPAALSCLRLKDDRVVGCVPSCAMSGRRRNLVGLVVCVQKTRRWLTYIPCQGRKACEGSMRRIWT